MRDHPLAQLTLARMREFYREPEAIFWVFGFPIVLAFALGIAFRNRGPGELRIAVLRHTGDSALAAALGHAPGLAVTVLDSAAARLELRTGRVALLVIPGERLVYRYDSTRTESRLARLQVDDAVQRARGRADAVRVEDERVTEPGPHHRGGLRTDEPRDAPDVDPVGYVLLVRPLPRDDAAVRARPAAHGAERRAAGRHDRRQSAHAAGHAARDRDGVGLRELRRRPADLSVALGQGVTITTPFIPNES